MGKKDHERISEVSGISGSGPRMVLADSAGHPDQHYRPCLAEHRDSVHPHPRRQHSLRHRSSGERCLSDRAGIFQLSHDGDLPPGAGHRAVKSRFCLGSRARDHPAGGPAGNQLESDRPAATGCPRRPARARHDVTAGLLRGPDSPLRSPLFRRPSLDQPSQRGPGGARADR